MSDAEEERSGEAGEEEVGAGVFHQDCELLAHAITAFAGPLEGMVQRFLFPVVLVFIK
jgi:hypothetical protein